MKKFFLAATIAALLGLGVFFVWRHFNPEPPLEFSATSASADWRIYSNDRFHIKYPADVNAMDRWSIHQFPDASIVTFKNGASGFGLSVWWRPDSDAGFAKPQKELQSHGKIAKIAGVEARYVQETAANSHGRVRIDGFSVPAPSGTYQIHVSNDFANFDQKLGGSGLLNPLAQEMIGTFGMHETKRSDYLTYTDSRYHFTFSYPAGCDVNFSAGRVSLMSRKSNADYWISFEVMRSTALPYEIEKHSRSRKIEEKREHFAHKIVGRKYMDGTAEGYYFEKDDFVLKIHMFRIEGPRKPVDDVLDSLEL